MLSASGCDLTYNIIEQRLYGRIGTGSIDARAVSGGRAGSKTSGVVNEFLANNPYGTTIKKAGNFPGGAIPTAKYYLKTHETRPNWIRLLPMPGEGLHGRDGFAIHGRGQRGSDGCIVPMDFHNVVLIHKLVRNLELAGKPPPTLAVVAIGDFKRFDDLMNTV